MADAGRVEEWRASFQQASRLLFDATNGCHQFGEIRVCNGSAGAHDADAWLREEDGRSNSPLLGLGQAGAHMVLYGDERFKPFVILRHFAQYAYGVCDEFVGPGDVPAWCVEDATSDACVMEAAWTDGDRFGADGTGGPLVPGRVRRFCTRENHDPDGDTLQQSVHGMSCWETMVAAFPELAAPAAGATFSGIDWVTQTSDPRLVIVLDRSGSMADDGKLNEAKIGAHFMIDAARAGEQLGVVSFADRANLDSPVVAMEDAGHKTQAHDEVNAVSAGGNTAIGDGLRAALDALRSAGANAPTRTAVLVTDGIHNTGEDPETVLPDLIAARVRVYTIGVGISVGTALLQRIADATGGEFARIATTQPGNKQAEEIRHELERVFGLVRNNGGIVAAQPLPFLEGTQRVTRTVEVESGSEAVTFLVSWNAPGASLELTLHAPNGETIAVGALPDGVHEIRGDYPYAAFAVDSPVEGPWEIEVTALDDAAELDARLLVFSEHPRIDGGLTVKRGTYQPGDEVPVFLRTYYDRPVTNLRVRGVARLPDGGRAPLRFVDDGDPSGADVLVADGRYSARLDDTHNAPGTYVFDVTVESTDSSAVVAGGEPVSEAEHFEAGPVPAFRRRLTTAVVVGDEPFEGGPD
ncbi:Mg-chelatase subunit ChlD [Pseudonocardia eucalypti]|uniref:VWA domain-containing protein n=1 Tax=Pseudonocardia eucalypti TaxID=648755 RepID=UPI0016135E3A|nr:Mg-chelatase subunit ChlD [Pseudonocardia eucalypti]